jgi:DNA-binding transcriptional LysR family regulator
VTVSISGLQAIASLDSEGSMTAAARALGYTPSAVSQQISKLERDVHQVLVEQNGRVATLSAAGRLVADVAHRILDEIEEMQAQLENQRKTVAGTLTLAAFATATRGIVPAALRGLRANWPGLECHLVEADSHHAMALVEDGSVDIAVVHDWLEMPLVLSAGLSARRLGDDISDALVHESHPLAGCGSVAMADLSDEAWLYEPGSVAHDLLIRSFAGVPNARRFEHVVVEYASQIAMVAEGMGVALVPRMGRGAVPDTVRVLPVEPTPTRQVYAVWRSLRGARPALRAAVLALRESFADTVAETSPRSRPAEAVLVAQAAADRIASDSWKALKRCPVAKLASMPDRNTNAGASLDGCTMPIFIFSV